MRSRLEIGGLMSLGLLPANTIIGNNTGAAALPIAMTATQTRVLLGLATTNSPTFNALTLTQATGTAPLTITSTTKVTNLNVDQVDGFDLDQDVRTTASPTFVRLTSTVATGTAPFTIASTTLVNNLNADLWDGFQFADYLNQAVKTTSSPSFVSMASTVATGTAPLTVSSTTVVTNLNADTVDSRHETEFALLAGRATGQTLNGGTGASENLTLSSTAHATKGKIYFDNNAVYDEKNIRLGIGTLIPANILELSKDTELTAIITLYNDTAEVSPTWTVRRARGTATSPSKPIYNDLLGRYTYANYDGSTQLGAIQLKGYAGYDTSGGFSPGTFKVYTSNAGVSGAPADRFTVAYDGNVGIGSYGQVNTPEFLLAFASAATERVIGVDSRQASNVDGTGLGIEAGRSSRLGRITALNATPTAAGSGYVLGEFLTITTGDGTAICYITAVDGSGGVTSIDTVPVAGKRGSGYSTGAGQATTGGSGVGCTVNITTVAIATNKQGGDLRLSSGGSTGTGTSKIIFQTATASASGTTDNAPSTKMTILGSGNVGIGETSPSTKLQVVGTGRFGTSTATGNYLDIASDGDLSFVGTAAMDYGHMYLDSDTTVTVLAATTWYEVTAGFVTGKVHNTTFGGTHYIQVSKAGNYLITYSASLETALTGDDLECTVAINGTASATAKAGCNTTATNLNDNGAGTTILTLAANDQISIAVRNMTAIRNITVTHANLSALLIGGATA